MSTHDLDMPILSSRIARRAADDQRLLAFGSQVGARGQTLLIQNMGDRLQRRYSAISAPGSLSSMIAQRFIVGEQTAPNVDLLLPRSARPPAVARWAARWPDAPTLPAQGPTLDAGFPDSAPGTEPLLHDLVDQGWGDSDLSPRAPVGGSAAPSSGSVRRAVQPIRRAAQADAVPSARTPSPDPPRLDVSAPMPLASAASPAERAEDVRTQAASSSAASLVERAEDTSTQAVPNSAASPAERAEDTSTQAVPNSAASPAEWAEDASTQAAPSGTALPAERPEDAHTPTPAATPSAITAVARVFGPAATRQPNQTRALSAGQAGRPTVNTGAVNPGAAQVDRSAVASPAPANLAAIDLTLLRPAGLRTTALLRRFAPDPLARMGFLPAAPPRASAAVVAYDSGTGIARSPDMPLAAPAEMRPAPDPRMPVARWTDSITSGPDYAASGAYHADAQRPQPDLPIARRPQPDMPIARWSQPEAPAAQRSQPETPASQSSDALMPPAAQDLALASPFPRADAPDAAAPAPTAMADPTEAAAPEPTAMADPTDAAAPEPTATADSTEVAAPLDRGQAAQADSPYAGSPASPLIDRRPDLVMATRGMVARRFAGDRAGAVAGSEGQASSQSYNQGRLVAQTSAPRLMPLHFSELVLQRMLTGAAGMALSSARPARSLPGSAPSAPLGESSHIGPAVRRAVAASALSPRPTPSNWLAARAHVAADLPLTAPDRPVTLTRFADAQRQVAGGSDDWPVGTTVHEGQRADLAFEQPALMREMAMVDRMADSEQPAFSMFAQQPLASGMGESLGLRSRPPAAGLADALPVARMPYQPAQHAASAHTLSRRDDGSYAGNAPAELPLATPAALMLQRVSEQIQRVDGPDPADSAAAPRSPVPPGQPAAAAPEDSRQIERMANQVYEHLRRRLLIDQERRGSSM